MPFDPSEDYPDRLTYVVEADVHPFRFFGQPPNPGVVRIRQSDELNVCQWSTALELNQFWPAVAERIENDSDSRLQVGFHEWDTEPCSAVCWHEDGNDTVQCDIAIRYVHKDEDEHWSATVEIEVELDPNDGSLIDWRIR